MKNKILISIYAVFALLMMSCNDSFLDQKPETDITEANFFKSDADLELYSNQFYNWFMHNSTTTSLVSSFADWPSDNNPTVNTTPEIYKRLSGGLSAATASQWDWSSIRTVNFMIARANNATGTNVKHYIGLARLVRALLYYDKVRTYSDVPWYSRDLQTTDKDLLYKAQDPRALVVDSIMADLDYAVANMNTVSDRTLLGKEVALAIQGRIALSEGSWRKYHSELGLNDANTFYQKAASACEQLMALNEFSLNSSYADNFRNNDLKGNPEMIMYQDNNKDLGLMWSYNDVWGGMGGFSRDLEETYLYVKDGKTMPFTSVEGYNKMGVNELFKNRDPRLIISAWSPGVCAAGIKTPFVPLLSHVGYNVLKWNGTDTNCVGYGPGQVCFGDYPSIRYAEVLLNYAEAKAELGTLTQADVDKTINLLRQRVGMPTASLSDWLSNIDPVLEAKYHNVTSTQKGAVLEVRRERRVELAYEGFRYNDLMRWALGENFAVIEDGIYIPHLGELDMTGDGVPDIAVVATTADKEAIASDIAKYNLTTYVLSDGEIKLSNGTSGYVSLCGVDGLFKFTSPRDYYYPISQQDMNINPNLVQNKFWK